MGCTIEFSDPFLRFEFANRNNKQKMLLDVLLKYSKLNLSCLSAILEVPELRLQAVHLGSQFLAAEQAEKLISLFLIFLSE